MTRQLATFDLDGLHFGVDVLRVQEIIRHKPMTPVPLAPSAVEGLINLRGQIVTALDLRRQLGFAPCGSDHVPVNVVVRAGDEVLSLVVDDIGDVVDVEDARFEAPAETLSGPLAALVTGLYKMDGRLLLVLDVDRTVAADGAVPLARH